jgi:hypothetical protein
MDLKILFIVLTFGLYACNTTQDKISDYLTSKKEINLNHPGNFTTPNGQEIRFLVKDSKYNVQWRQGDSLKTLNYFFNLAEGGHTSFPSLIAENKNYVLLRSGCGNPCWLGLFLPLYKGGKPQIVNEYIAFDLNSDLVAFISNTDSIAILNLKKFDKQYFNPGKCESAFPGYCIDTAYFKNNTFYYSWNSETTIRSKKAKIKEFALRK